MQPFLPSRPKLLPPPLLPLLWLAALLLSPRPAVAAQLLGQIGSIPLPNVGNPQGEFKFDHVDGDTTARRLFWSIKENNTVAVINMDAPWNLIASLPGVGAPQGVRVVPSLDLVFVAGDDDGAVHAFSLTPPFAQVWRVDLGGPGGGADDMAYDAASGLLYVGFGDISGPPFGAIAYIAVTRTSATWLGNISFPMGGHPEEFHLATRSSLLYASCPEAGSIVVVINRVTKTIVNQIHLLPFASDNYALELDEVNNRIFLGTYGNSPGSPVFGRPQFVVINMLDGSLVWSMPTTLVCDNILQEASRGIIFVACGGSSVPSDPSVLYVLQQQSANAYALLGTAAMPAPYLLARSFYWDAQTSSLFLGVPMNSGLSPPQQAQVVVFQLQGGPSPTPAAAQGGSTGPAGTAAVAVSLSDPATAGVISALTALVFICLCLLLAALAWVHRLRGGGKGRPLSSAAVAVASPQLGGGQEPVGHATVSILDKLRRSGSGAAADVASSSSSSGSGEPVSSAPPAVGEGASAAAPRPVHSQLTRLLQERESEQAGAPQQQLPFAASFLASPSGEGAEDARFFASAPLLAASRRAAAEGLLGVESVPTRRSESVRSALQPVPVLVVEGLHQHVEVNAVTTTFAGDETTSGAAAARTAGVVSSPNPFFRGGAPSSDPHYAVATGGEGEAPLQAAGEEGRSEQQPSPSRGADSDHLAPSTEIRVPVAEPQQCHEVPLEITPSPGPEPAYATCSVIRAASDSSVGEV